MFKCPKIQSSEYVDCCKITKTKSNKEYKLYIPKP